MNASDVILWDRWRQTRDAEAFGEIVARHSGTVFGACRRILRNTADAEDVAQDCFLELSRARDEVRSSLGAWLHTLAVRRALDRVRAEKRRRRHLTPPPAKADAPSHAETQELLDLVDEAIAELPEDYRVPVIQRFLEGRTHQALATELGISESTVRYRLQRGVEKIRSFLKQRGVEVGAASLLGALTTQLLVTAPASLTAQLGKIALAGSPTAKAGTTSTTAAANASSAPLAGRGLSTGPTPSRVLNPRALKATAAAAVLFVAASVLLLQQMEDKEPPRGAGPAAVAGTEAQGDAAQGGRADEGAAAENAGGDTAQSLVLSGTVRERESGRPLAGVTLKLGGESTLSADDGNYRVAAPAPGAHALAATLDAFVTDRRVVEISSQGETRQDLELEEAFVVVCVDPSGEALPGVEVRVADVRTLSEAPEDRFSPEWRNHGPVRTDSVGRAFFGDLPRNPRDTWSWQRTVLASVPKRLSSLSNLSFGGSSETPLPDTPHSMVLRPPLEIKGTVKVPEGFRPEETTVRLLTALVSDPKRSLRSAWLARSRTTRPHLWPELFEVQPLADGSFTLDRVPSQARVYLAAEGRGLGQAQFMSDQPQELLQATLELGLEGSIEGSLLLQDRLLQSGLFQKGGEAAEGIALEALPQGKLFYSEPFETITGADGSFRFVGLPPTAYNVALKFEPGLLEWTAPVRGLITVSAGKTTAGVDLELQRGTQVSGAVVDAENNQPIEGAGVTALQGPKHRLSRVASTKTDVSGRYTLRVPTGKSKLYLSGGTRDYETPENGELQLETAPGETQRDGVDFRLKRRPILPEIPRIETATARGRVVDLDGNPLPDIRVSGELTPAASQGGVDLSVLLFGRNRQRQARTDASGSFEVTVLAGKESRVAVRAAEYSSAVSEAFELDLGETHHLEDLRVRVGTSFIEGQVTDAEGRPVDAAFVLATSRSKSARELGRKPQTDGEGRFRIAHLMDDEAVDVLVRKLGFEIRNWNRIPPGSQGLRFVLHKLDGEAFHLGEKEPPKPRELLGKPAPEWDVGQWIRPPAPGPNPQRIDGKKTIVLFSWSNEEWSTLGPELKDLERLAESYEAAAVVIFATTAHESTLKQAIETYDLSLAIGIDRFVSKSEYKLSNATMIRYGFGEMPMVFVIDAEGIVRRVQAGLAGLEERLGGI